MQRQHWPALELLELGTIRITLSDFLSFIHAHSTTLRQLKLTGVNLSGLETWQDLANQVGRLLSLDWIQVRFLRKVPPDYSMSSHDDVHELSRREMVHVVKIVMQSVKIWDLEPVAGELTWHGFVLAEGILGA